MEEWNVEEANIETDPNGTEHFVFRLRKENGTHVIQVVPTLAIAARAAEYDIDHTTEEGRAQIIDMILHEPHMDEVSDPAAGPVAMARSSSAKAEPTTLWNASSRAKAKEAHLKRVEKAKSERRNIVWEMNPTRKATTVRTMAKGKSKPCQVLMDYTPDEGFLEEHKSRVRLVRHLLGAQILPESELPTAEPDLDKKNKDDGLQNRNRVLKREGTQPGTMS